MGVSVFTEALLDATGLSRLTFADAYLVGTVTSGVLLPRGGRLLDRIGARPTAFVAAIALAVTLLFLAQADRVAGWLGDVAGATTTSIWVSLAVGFTFLRFSGQGMLTMVSRTMLGKWFDRRRGLASAISGVFVAFGFGLAPRVLSEWVDTAGWRGAWKGLALVVGLAMGSIAYVFLRDNPEECGLAMDGRGRNEAGAPEVSASRAEAIRRPASWALTLALGVHACVITGVTFHIVDLGAAQGMERDVVVDLFLPMTVASTVTGMLVGWAADRMTIRMLGFVMLGAQGIGCAATTVLSKHVGYAPAALGLGVSGGFFGPLTTVALPRFFGRQSLGAIGGAQSMVLVLGCA